MHHPAVFYRLFAATVALSAIALAPACAAPLAPSPAPTMLLTAELPAWEGRLAQLFDDRIDRSSLDRGVPPASDELLKARAQAADHIVYVTVQGFRTDQSSDGTVHNLLVGAGEPVAGRRAPDNLELAVGEANPFQPVMAKMGPRLMGRTFIAYLKSFKGAQGPELHWFMTADSPKLTAAIREVHLLMEVRAGNP
jgi:hypothetical protein